MTSPLRNATNTTHATEKESVLPATPKRPAPNVLRPLNYDIVSSPVQAPSPPRCKAGAGHGESHAEGFFPSSPLTSPCRATRLDPSPIRPTTPKRKRLWNDIEDFSENDIEAFVVENSEEPAHDQGKNTTKHWGPRAPTTQRRTEDVVKPLPQTGVYARGAWESGRRFGVPLSIHTALMGRELYGSIRQGPIMPSMRNYVSSFVSTEYDQYRILAEDTTYVPPFACSFGNTRMNAQYLAVADEEGMIGIINAEHDARWEQENPRTRWLAHHNAIFDICWTSDDRHLVSAAGDQTVRIWDVETQKCTIIFQGHNCSIKSVANHPRNPHLFATAARDGRIMTWDTRCSSIPTDSEELYYRPTNTINSAHALTNGTVQGPRKPRRSASALSATTNPSQSVTSVRYVPSVETMLVSSGAADGLIKIWDMRSPGSYSRKDAPLPQAMSSPLEGARRAHGFSSLCLNSRGSRIYAACTDNYVYEFDTNHLGKPIQRFSGAEYRCDTFYIKTTMSPDDRFLASGSSDHGLYIWEVDAPHKPPLALRAHRGEVTGVSWSKQELSQLASCSDDASVRIWNVDMDYNEDEQNMAYRDSRGRAEEGRLREEQEPAAPKERTPSRARTSDENDENEPPRPVSASSRVDRSSATSTPPPLSSARRGRAGQPAGSRRSGSASRSGSRAPNGRTIADYFPSPTTLR